MQLEESGNSKDVPPLSCCGSFELSSFVDNKCVDLSGFNLVRCIISCSNQQYLPGVRVAQEVLG
jgi:hypothetical protein